MTRETITQPAAAEAKSPLTTVSREQAQKWLDVLDLHPVGTVYSMRDAEKMMTIATQWPSMARTVVEQADRLVERDVRIEFLERERDDARALLDAERGHNKDVPF